MEYGAQALDPKDFQEARKQLLDLERKLGRIRITCQTEGAEVTLDGVTLFIGPGSQEIWAKAKSHEVTAKRPDYLSEARRMTVAAGESKTLDLRLITLSEAEESSRRWAIWKPWSVVAAGGVVAAAALVLRSIASNDFSSYDKKFAMLPCAQGVHAPGCPTNDPMAANLSGQLRTARREQAIAVSGFIAGSSMFGTGLVLLYMNRSRLPEQGAMSSSIRSAVSPIISGDMLGILVSVSH